MMHSIDEFIRAYFDKLLLTFILFSLFGLERWDMANTVLGAIIMLTTGAIIAKGRNGNGNGKEPANVGTNGHQQPPVDPANAVQRQQEKEGV